MKRNGLLIVGASSKHCGKTHLICRVLENFSPTESIAAIKITSIYDDLLNDPEMQGELTNIPETYDLTECFLASEQTDTSRYLKAGASKSFWLRTRKQFLSEAIHYTLSQINEISMLICESNSIRSMVDPDVFLMIQKAEADQIKPSASEFIAKADLIILNRNGHVDDDVCFLKIENGLWKINNCEV